MSIGRNEWEQRRLSAVRQVELLQTRIDWLRDGHPDAFLTHEYKADAWMLREVEKARVTAQAHVTRIDNRIARYRLGLTNKEQA